MTEKRKHLPAVLFTAAFFALCVFFSLGMLLPGAADAADSGDMPRLLVDGKISETYRDDFEEWFSKHFAYRDILVDAFSLLKEKVFHTGNDQVIVGRDGFLFFAETLPDYTGSDPMTDGELIAAADALKNLSDYAEEHGAEFLFLCAPNKNTIYPEKMPLTVASRGEASSNLDRLLPLLDERGVNCLDVRPALLAAKEERLVYHKRDSHWNNEGARIAVKAVLEAADIPLDLIGTPLTEVTHDFRGDLDSLLYPKTPRYDDEFVLEPEAHYRTVAGSSSLMSLDIQTISDLDRIPVEQLLMFRDSFGSALIPYFASVSGSARFHRALPYRIDLLEETASTASPRLVVIEIAERNLKNLIGSDARIAG
ncbi:MAG: hypothetical protein II889_09715 [Clostridia bacterium]|nr:hypothetical protein [Clostridia bacterium]